MPQWCLCVTEEREIRVPKLFVSYAEAYEEMMGLLIQNIINNDRAGKHLGEDNKILDAEEARDNFLFDIELADPEGECTAMWSNLDDDYALDAKIFKICLSENARNDLLE